MRRKRSTPDDQRATKFQLLLIVAWHWTVLPATLAVVHWLLGYGESVGGVAVQPKELEAGRVAKYFHPMMAATYLSMLLIEGLLSWFTFRLALRRLRPSFRSFVRCWWRVCWWGIIAVPAVCVTFAVLSRDYDAAMNLPLLWVVCAAVGSTLLFKIESHRPPPGHCQSCGYNLTGNTSGRCPECGEPVPAESSGEHGEAP